MSDKTEKQTKKPQETAEDAAILDFIKAAEKLSPEQHERAAEIGFVVPQGDARSALRNEYKIGYRCKNCNKIGLYFVGTKWPNGQQIIMEGPDRILLDVPPLNLPIDQISWTQPGKKSSEINRHRPTCMHCGHAMELGYKRRPRAKFVVDVARFETSRDKGFDRRSVRELQQKMGPDQITDVDSNYDRKETAPSEFMTQEERDTISDIHQRHDPLAAVQPGQK